MTNVTGSTELNYQGEQIWREFKGHLEWADNFSLIILFTDSIAISELFYQRSKSVYSGELAKTQRYKPSKTELENGALNSQTLSFIEQLPKQPCPVWLELSHLSQYPGDINNLLQRLNERREKLRQQINSALVITLPLVLSDKLNTIAPDLWSIRTASYRVSISEHCLLDTFSLVGHRREERNHTFQTPDISLITEEPLYKEWQRLVAKGKALEISEYVTELAYLVARLLLEKGDEKVRTEYILWGQSILLSFSIDSRGKSLINNALGDLYFFQGELDKAEEHYQQALTSLEKQQNSSPHVLRDLAIFLTSIADVKKQKGDLDNAMVYYQKAFNLEKSIHQQLGDTPNALRSLSLSLNNIADIEQYRDVDVAESYYLESLSLTREIQTQVGNSSQVLRDISVPMERLADISLQKGKLDSAIEAYQTCLNISRQVWLETGNTPETLRDISICLEKIADIELIKGEKDDALQHYTESLDLLKSVLEQVGETPNVLRDITVSLGKIANIELTNGQLNKAHRSFEEVLELRLKIRQKLGDTWESLSDISIALFNLSNLYKAKNNIELARKKLKESLSFMEHAKDMSGGLPQIIDNIDAIKTGLKKLEIES